MTCFQGQTYFSSIVTLFFQQPRLFSGCETRFTTILQLDRPAAVQFKQEKRRFMQLHPPFSEVRSHSRG